MFGNLRSVHFIGIGGTAMASAAAAMHQLGYQVSGSDQDVIYPPMSTFLAERGIRVNAGYAEANLALR
ncbi:MAG: Mur ligase domain-containing protein, partial [Verrucomicrobium sp.]|nr:Mur ligase domain-containing protein [Verrucomicrobium sp.]